MSSSTDGCLKRACINELAFEFLEPFVGDGKCEAGIGVQFGTSPQDFCTNLGMNLIVLLRV